MSEGKLSAYRQEVLQRYKEAGVDVTGLDDPSIPLEEFEHRLLSHAKPRYHNKHRWDLSPAGVKALAEEVIARTKAVLDAVASVPEGKHSWDTVMAPLAEVSGSLAPLWNTAEFVAHVSPDPEVREASTEADQMLSAFRVEVGMREDVYKAVAAYAETEEAKKLTGEKKRLVERMLRDFKRNGLHLPKEQREKIKALQQEMAKLSIEFQKNLREDKTALYFTKEELDGVPEDVLNMLTPTPEGKLTVLMQYPIIYPLLKYCKVEETRKQVEYAFNRRCIDTNTPILEKLVTLRAQHAEVLGFPTHAAYILDIRMAKTPENVMTFLKDLSKKLDPLVEKEMKSLLALKQAEKGKDFDGKINGWDLRYYLTRSEERDFMIDHNKIKEYFPLDVVTRGLLEIYQRLLGLRFEEVTNPHVWHPEVRLFNVYNAADNAFVGQFYLDLHPRQGKYSHAACFGLTPSCVTKYGRQFPVAAMVANFSRPVGDKPALLSHDEVRTFYHEFGHVMHQVCSTTEFDEFAGTAVERDFVEAPSQMLENWVYEKEALAIMSEHYRTKEKLPDELIHKLIAARNANIGLLTKRQIVFALFDQLLHTRSEAKTAELYEQVSREVTPIPVTPGTNMTASFGHLAGGYDAQYYGYLYSEVISDDMFASRFAGKILDPEAGLAYRKEILSVGGSRDAMDSIKAFLGREPSQEAFLKQKGLASVSA